MKLVETLMTALSALAAHKLRSFLTMLGIIIGVSSVVVMMGLGGGAQKEVEAQIDAMGTNMLVIRSGTRHGGGISMGAGVVPRLQYSDARAIADEVAGVLYVAPQLFGKVQVVRGNTNWSTSLQGVTPDYLKVHNWQLGQGYEPDVRGWRGSSKEVLLGATVARELFGAETPLGQSIRINKVPFVVSGVLKPKGENMMGNDQDDFMLVPMATARKRILGVNKSAPDRVNMIAVQVADLQDMESVSGQIRSLLAQRHKLKPGQESAFRVTNLTERMTMRAETSQIFNSLLAGVACVSLLVGGIGIMNIMLVSVTERTREIGVRLALGARRKDVLLQFLIEAVVLCGIGGVLGILLALVGLAGAEYLTGLPVYIQPWVSVASTLFSALIGLFFGFYPARKASRLNPVDALRYD